MGVHDPKPTNDVICVHSLCVGALWVGLWKYVPLTLTLTLALPLTLTPVTHLPQVDSAALTTKYKIDAAPAIIIDGKKVHS